MATTVADPLIGRLVDGRYEITARIARGGMATVYRALDRRLDRVVALKVMHSHLAEGGDVVARFRREARAAARLAHPGVVGVFDQGSADDLNYLTMEFVDGSTLRTALRQRGAFALGEALRIVEHVLSALAAAHNAGLVHRDVKPENILVATTGEVKVADFGLARAVSEATAASTGSLLGTVAYLSPEIVTSGHADARADVYAVGAMLYEILTGQQPFRGETPIQVAYQHVHDDIPHASDSVRWLPTEIDDLIHTMTAREPADRPGDATAALTLLRRVREALEPHQLAIRAEVKGSGVESGAPLVTATVPATDDVADRPEETSDIGHTGTVSLPIGAVTAQTPPSPRRSVKRRRVSLILTFVVLIVGLGAAGTWWYLTIGPGAYAIVPNVADSAEIDALADLEAAGFNPKTTAEFSDNVPQGNVIGTDPGAGTQLKLDGEIAVVVSRGIEMLTVPHVAKMKESDAIAAIEESGLTVAKPISRQYSDDIPQGAVLSISPKAGAEIRHDKPVQLTISQGRAPIEIPDVAGADQATAEADLKNAGAVAQVEGSRFHDSIPEGHVISQTPKSGSGFKGDVVMLTVSKGPELIPVPDVFGMQYAQAAQTLEAAGFTVQRENVLGGIFGTVHSQSIPAGAKAKVGSQVILKVV